MATDGSGSSWWSNSGTSMSATNGRGLATDLQLLSEYLTNDAVFSVADINARAMAKYSWRVYATSKSAANDWDSSPVNSECVEKLRRREGLPPSLDWALRHGTAYELRNHPWQDTLDNQGTNTAGAALRYWNSVNIDLFGCAYWMMNHTMPIAASIRKMQPFQVILKINDAGTITKYRWMPYFPGNSSTIDVSPDQVISFRVPGVTLADAERHPALQSAYKQANANYEFTKMIVALLSNSGKISAIFSPSGDTTGEELSKEVARRFENGYMQKFGGSRQGGILIAPKGTLAPVVYPPSDLNGLKINQETVKRIAAAFGVPEALLSKDATYANSKAAMDFHAKYTLVPRMAFQETPMNQYVQNVFGSDICVAFDSPVPEDQKEKNARLAVLISGGAITVDELRGRMGLLPLPKGVGKEMIAGTARVQIAEQAPVSDKEPQPDRVPMADREPTADDGRQRALDELTLKSAQSDFIIKLNERVAEGNLSRNVAISLLAGYSGHDEQRIQKLIGYAKKESESTVAIAQVVDQAIIQKAIDDTLAKMKASDNQVKQKTILRLNHELTPLTKAVDNWLNGLRPALWADSGDPTKKTGDDTLTAAVLSLLMSIGHEEAIYAASQLGVEGQDALKEVYKNIDDAIKTQWETEAPLMIETTKTQIKNLAEAEGVSREEAEKWYFKLKVPDRVARIAEDQGFRSQVIADKLVLAKGNIIGIWRTMEDEKVCPQCRALDGSKALPGGMFHGNGISAPGPGFHPNCRCEIQWVPVNAGTTEPPKTV